jgi:ribonuclease D
MPPENLIQPEPVRRLAWQPPAELTAGAVAEALARHGARPWQLELVAGPLAEALAEPETEPETAPETTPPDDLPE